MSFDTISDAISAIAAGQLVIVTDDETRENEGDFVMGASKVTPEAINVMLRYGRGLICVPTTDHQLKRLGLNPMVQNNQDEHHTDFAVSVDAAEGITTGISAYDRSTTIKILADPDSMPTQLIQPGHVFPLRARAGGVLERAGHTEAAVDLASLAGLHPSGVICEILTEDGHCARLPDLIALKQTLGIKLVSIADLIQYRYKSGRFVQRIETCPFSSAFGQFDLHIFRNTIDGCTHLALSKGKLDAEPTLVRVQSQDLLGDVFREKGNPSSASIEAALKAIAKEGRGVCVYLSQAPRATLNTVEAKQAELQAKAMPTDFRNYGVGAQILVELGLRQIRLLSATQRKVVALDGYGIEIVEQVAL